MSKITITLEDVGDNKVRVVANPTFEQLAMKSNSGEALTSADGYALLMMRAVREESKKQANQMKIYIPRIGR